MESEEEVTETARDTYHRRRTVETGELADVVIKDVRVLEDSGKYGRKNTLQGVIDVAGDTYVIEEQYRQTATPDGPLVELLDSATHGPTLDFDSIAHTTVSLAFNEEFTQCGTESGAYTMDITPLEEATLGNTELAAELDDRLSLRAYYDEQDPAGTGWNPTITGIDADDEETFTVSVATGVGPTLSWALDVPRTTDPDASAVARLVETVGHGDVQQLTGENIYIVRSDDTDRHLKTVGTDSTGEWELVVPTDFEQWDDRRKKYERQKQRSQTSTSSSRRTTTRNNDYRAKARDALVYGLGTPLMVYMTRTLLEIMGLQQEIASQSPELYTTLMSILDMMAVFGALAGLFGAVIYFTLGTMNE